MSAPKSCPCQFCGENFTAAGIKNHERACDENPHSGVHPDDAPQLFEQDSSAEPSAGGRPSADPDQSVEQPDALPSRDTLPAGNKSSSSLKSKVSGTSDCPNCGSSDTLPAHEARQKFAARMDPAPDELLATFDATERYCCDCFAVWGGELSDPWPITEGFA